MQELVRDAAFGEGIRVDHALPLTLHSFGQVALQIGNLHLALDIVADAFSGHPPLGIEEDSVHQRYSAEVLF